MAKSPEMERMLNDLTKGVFGRERNSGACVTCGIVVNPDTDFRNEISKREWHISFMCQACQDSVFGAD